MDDLHMDLLKQGPGIDLKLLPTFPILAPAPFMALMLLALDLGLK
jgi:hypothetical protein